MASEEIRESVVDFATVRGVYEQLRDIAVDVDPYDAPHAYAALRAAQSLVREHLEVLADTDPEVFVWLDQEREERPGQDELIALVHRAVSTMGVGVARQVLIETGKSIRAERTSKLDIPLAQKTGPSLESVETVLELPADEPLHAEPDLPPEDHSPQVLESDLPQEPESSVDSAETLEQVFTRFDAFHIADFLFTMRERFERLGIPSLSYDVWNGLSRQVATLERKSGDEIHQWRKASFQALERVLQTPRLREELDVRMGVETEKDRPLWMSVVDYLYARDSKEYKKIVQIVSEELGISVSLEI